LYILSKNLKEYWFNYVWQSSAAGIVTVLAIYIFSDIIGLFILAGVGSTFFTVFALPNNRTAMTRNIIGSYIISIFIGLVFLNLFSNYARGGLTVGLATFLMVITDTEHPPAAGIALGLAMGTNFEIILKGSVFALSGAILSSLLRYFFKPWLKDLF
jgi:CBS-domain-containing membrane protein